MGPEVASEVTVVCHTEEWRTQKDLVIYDAWQSIVQLQLSYFRHLQLLMLTKIDIGMLKYELVSIASTILQIQVLNCKRLVFNLNSKPQLNKETIYI